MVLANIELTLNTWTVVGDSVTVLSDWVASADGQLLTNFTETERKTTLASLSHLGVAMLHIQINQAHLDVSQAPAYYVRLHVQARLLPSGYLALHFKSYRSWFETKWANPLWEALEIPLSSEHQQISDLIVRLFERVTIKDQQAPLTDMLLATSALPRLVPAKLARWGRAGVLAGQAVLDAVWTPPWDYTAEPGSALEAEW